MIALLFFSHCCCSGAEAEDVLSGTEICLPPPFSWSWLTHLVCFCFSAARRFWFFPTGFRIFYFFLLVSHSRSTACFVVVRVLSPSFAHLNLQLQVCRSSDEYTRASRVSCLSDVLSLSFRPASAEGRVMACLRRRRRGSSVPCPVCLDVFQPQDAITLVTCGHAFHWKCVEPWLERSSRCPCCR